MQFDDVNIGGQLKVGTGVCRAIKEGRQKINGSALVEGPMVVGGPDVEVGVVVVGVVVDDDGVAL